MKAYANYKIIENEIKIYCECPQAQAVFSGVAPISLKNKNWYDDLFTWIDNECNKRGWQMERLVVME